MRKLFLHSYTRAVESDFCSPYQDKLLKLRKYYICNYNSVDKAFHFFPADGIIVSNPYSRGRDYYV